MAEYWDSLEFIFLSSLAQTIKWLFSSLYVMVTYEGGIITKQEGDLFGYWAVKIMLLRNFW